MKRFSRVPFPASGIVIALILLVFSWTGVAAGAPLITSLFPAKGPVGSLVTLEGSGFTDYQGLSSVDFGKNQEMWFPGITEGSLWPFRVGPSHL